MATPFSPYVIGEFKTGIATYLQPWRRAIDAFSPLQDAYVFRGCIQKRSGYSQFGNDIPDGNPVMGIMRYVDQTSGTNFLLVATTVHLYQYVDPNYIVVAGITFTGTISNFFNFTNWQPNSGGPSYLFMSNNVDPVTFWDGTAATQPTLTVDGAGTTISTCLDLKIYKQRILYIRPTLAGGGNPGVANQAIYWSAQRNPTGTRVDIAGQGGFAEAPTSDIIQSSEFVRDDLIVFFSNSTWILSYTGYDQNPFVWVKLNASKSNNTPYGTIDYDDRCTSIGKTGLIASDAVYCDRYDIPIIDYYETNFSQTYFSQTFAQRYDNLQQGWMLYVSNQNTFPLVGNVAPGSDQALIYNFLENSWATYTWSIPLTCLGTFFADSGATWASLQQSWEDTPVSWNSYSGQKGALILLAGDTTGHIYKMDDSTSLTDNGNPIIPQVVSTQWNPIMELGQKVQFGHIDIYYTLPQGNPANPISVTLEFMLDNSDDASATRTLTLDGPINATANWKRIYINLVGQFISMRIRENPISAVSDPFFKFLGFILWVRPSGRLTPGSTLS